MSFSLSWIAVPSFAKGQLLDVLKLSPTGRFQEVPEPDISGIEMPGGWYVVVRNHEEMTPRASADLTDLSRTVDIVACFVEEHVMVSWARGWSAGSLAWSVLHDSQNGLRHLETWGPLPPEFPELRDILLARADHDPAGPDYVFDVPVELAKRLTGFRHDEDPACGDQPFEELEPKKNRRRLWFV